FAAGALLLRVVGGGVACAGFVGAPAPGAKGLARGVLCTPFAAGALLLRVAGGGVACAGVVAARGPGARVLALGVLCTPFAAGALFLQFGGGFAVVVATTAGAPGGGALFRAGGRVVALFDGLAGLGINPRQSLGQAQ